MEKVSIVDKIIDCLTVDYVNFSGRASRSEYWYFILFCFLVGILLGLISGVAPGLKSTCNIILFIFQLVIIIPSIAVLTRRLHDHDKSGWWQLISLIPIIGGLYIFFLNCRRGTIGENSFGSDPLMNL